MKIIGLRIKLIGEWGMSTTRVTPMPDKSVQLNVCRRRLLVYKTLYKTASREKCINKKCFPKMLFDGYETAMTEYVEGMQVVDNPRVPLIKGLVISNL